MKRAKKEGKSNSNLRKMAVCGIFAALCLLMSYLESLLPSIFPFLPFAKLGLSNIVILFTVVCYGLGEGILVMGIKCLVIGLISANPFMIVYSLAGGLLSVLVEFFLIKLGKNSLIAISAVGGIFHGLGQVFMACVLTGSWAAFAYFPHLAIFGTISGAVVGFIVFILVSKIPDKLIYSKDEE